MQSNAKQNFRPADSIWVLLVELSLRDFLSDHDRTDGTTAGNLFQTLRELGMSPDCIENIVGTLAEFAKQGRLEFAGRFRIFCQRKILDNANSANTSKPYHTELDKKQKESFSDSEANTIGGWGYFMIEPGEDLSPDSFAIPYNYIDLYLYKEGE